MNYFSDIESSVTIALAEDTGTGDLTGNLVPGTSRTRARVITRQAAVVCGRPWVDEVFRQVDATVKLDWQVTDGSQITPDDILFFVEGHARSILTAERTALNYLQLLSATATRTRYFVDRIAACFPEQSTVTPPQLLDTRKTIPGLRLAQKYAVHMGGGRNHRIGLFDAFLIKENHIKATGSISRAIELARTQHPGMRVEVEVENLQELDEAIAAMPDWIMLDNFSTAQIEAAVARVPAEIKLEVSGGIDDADALCRVATTGVHFISMGTLTKDCEAIDLSMLFA